MALGVRFLYDRMELGLPGFGPRDTADWLKPVFVLVRQHLGWSIPDYWTDHGDSDA